MANQVKRKEIQLGAWEHNVEISKACKDIIVSAIQTILNVQNGESWLNYAPYLGHEDFRKTVAEFMSKQYGSSVSSDDILPTYGAASGLSQLASLLFHRGSLVFCENPTYGPSISVLRDDLGMNLIPISVDSDGIIVDELENKLEKLMSSEIQNQPRKSAYDGMLYVIPTIQNPTGTILSKERSERIIQLARKYNLLVACDDVYNLYWYHDSAKHPPPRLFSLDHKDATDYGIGHVVSNCTFSKILAPGLRVGWLEAPQCVIKKILESGENQGGGSPAGLMQGVATSAMKSGDLAKFLANTRSFYKQRMDFFVSLLRKILPGFVEFDAPKGGFFVWIKFPESISSTALAERCAKHGVMFPSSTSFTVDKTMSSCCRLCPSMSTEEELEFTANIIAKEAIYLHSQKQ